jgi:hypothetical protein
MMDWAQILVIILGVLFAIFLTVAIALAVMVVRLTKKIRNVTASAERALHSIESAAARSTKVVLPVTIISRVIQHLRKGKSHGNK